MRSIVRLGGQDLRFSMKMMLAPDPGIQGQPVRAATGNLTL